MRDPGQQGDGDDIHTLLPPPYRLGAVDTHLISPVFPHLTLQRIGRSRIIFIKIQTPVFYKYLLEIAFFYCEVQLIQQIRNQL